MNLDTAKAALKKYFGYDTFRPMQAEVIQSIYDKKDVLLIMPTGGGKSVCFQIPGVTMEGTCVVVSPLISLMKDQVESLRANGVRAAYLNSSLTYHEQQDVENKLFNGHLDLLYTSPEKMSSQEFLPLLKASKISLFAIDEAHCISAWGHDFRPEYRQLRFLKKTFPDIPVIALTATADKVTRKDIAQQAELKNPEVFVASFDRPNLHLEVRPGRKRIEQIMEFIDQHPHQSGIVYCLSKKSTEMVAERLRSHGVKAASYHAGMDTKERSKVQEDFINDRTPIICATVAFGMGIDKSNVRWVIHYNLPKNIESYYQEIGRAGRDGLRADTLLFFSMADLVTLREMLQKSESQHVDVYMSKLDRMHQFATAMNCRRKILLNYFNDATPHDCNNCDVCENPPSYEDGTVTAQKALSAVARLQGQASIGMLVDVLRGSKGYSVVSKGFDKIKTYGAGKEHSKEAWFSYLEQLLNQGLLEIAYDDSNKLKLTEASRAILFDGQKVQLVKAETITQRQEEERAKAEEKKIKKTDRQRVRDELFERLRDLRLTIARQKGVPPYIVFTDATLEEMAAERPVTQADLSKISGVGELKMRDYGQAFLDAIEAFLSEKKSLTAGTQSANYLETLNLHNRHLTLEEMAEVRGLAIGTICHHLIHLYNSNEPVDLIKYVGTAEYQRIAKALEGLEAPYKMKDVFEKLNGEVNYEKIRLGLAVFEDKKNLKFVSLP